MNHRSWLLTAALTGAVSCSSPHGNPGNPSDVGSIELTITNTPAAPACLKVSVAGSARTVNKSFDLSPGQSTVFTVKGLPVGIAQVTAEAFGFACANLPLDASATYVLEAPVSVRIDATDVVKVLLKLVRNGRLLVEVDFEASQQAHNVPVLPGALVKPLFTVGESVNAKPDGSPYRMVGILDGTGAYDNGDGTFTVLASHELGNNSGIPRLHGARGAFVSKWTIRKSNLTVLKGEDLTKEQRVWDKVAGAYTTPAAPVAWSRFCSSDLPARSAFWDGTTGYDGRLYMNGQESGDEGTAWAHGLDGVSWELPALGKFSWEQSVANPKAQAKTIVAGFDGSIPGQVYVYVGAKTNTGNPVQKAGLTNGKLFGVKVTGFAGEPAATGIPSGTAFTMQDFGSVVDMTGGQLNTASHTAGVTNFQRPEDGAWDPQNPNDLYFVTTASFTTATRLWRLRFVDIANPEMGGTIDMLLDGTEAGRMYDDIAVNTKGHVILQEDVGGQDHLGKTWRYEIATDKLTLLLQANPALFTPGAPQFLTRDEEASGVIDMIDILGPGWYIAVNQAHYDIGDTELVEGGQLFAFFDPAGK